MTEEYNNNNNEEYSSEAIHNKSKKGSQDKELLKVLEALESQGFRLFDYHENWFGSSLVHIKTNPGTVFADYNIFIIISTLPFCVVEKNLN